MSRFTFAAGNARRLTAAPLYLLGALATRVLRRRSEIWAIGSGSGVGEGALALARHARQSDPTLRIVWLARSEADRAAAARHGFRAVLKDSMRGFRVTARAGVVIVTHGLGDVNRYAVRGGFLVQLWHGVPLKRIQLDAPVTFASGVLPRVLPRLLRRAYRRSVSRVRLMPAAGDLAAERLSSAFGLPADRVVVTGDPRDDVVLNRDPEAARRELADRLLLPRHRLGRVVLYAPTWRDGEPDPAAPAEEDWRQLAAWAEQAEATLVIRPHHLGVGDYAEGPRRSDRIRLLPPSEAPDVNPLLPAVDVLVTDYSSIAYDFCLTGRPILYLAPDLDAYTTSRGLYEPYERFSGGREVSTWGAILEQLRRLDADPLYDRQVRGHTESVRAAHHRHLDGRNTGRVYDEIRRRSGAS